jgi:hypothetical protein
MRFRWTLRAAAFSVILISGCRSIGCAKVKKASSPESAVQLMETAKREGNRDQYLALLPKPQREFMVKITDALKKVQEAQKAFDEALDSKFGKTSDKSPVEVPNPTEMMGKKDPQFRLEIVSQQRKDDNTTVMKLKATRTDDEKSGSTKSEELDCTAIKEDDGWKLNMGNEEMSDSDAGVKFMTVMFERQIKGLEQTTADIKSGKIQSRIEAWKALAAISTFKP